MTPFLQFRLWVRRAPIGERLLAATLGVVILLVAAWALVSVDTTDDSTLSASGGPGGTPTSQGGGTSGGSGGGHGGSGGGTGGSAVGSGGGGTFLGGGTGSTGSGGTGGGTGSTGGGGHGSGGTGGGSGRNACGPDEPDQGVTRTELHIDVIVANLAGSAGNGLVGLPSAAEQIEMFKDRIAAENATGGVRCRTLVAKYYTANPLNQASLEAVCLDVVADNPFALIDLGLSSPAGSPTPRQCPPKHHIPLFGSLPMSADEMAAFAPYMFSYFATSQEIVRNWVHATQQLGWFRGYSKVGVLEQTCVPELNTITRDELARIGIPDDKVTSFNFGCPNQIPSPVDVQQAVLKFKRENVSHVLDDAGVYANYFSKVAARQDYKPKYSVGDQGTIALWNNPQFGPDPRNFEGGIAITGTEYGAEHTPGFGRSAPTKHCDRLMTKRGNKPSMKSKDGFTGVVCSLVTMFATAANNASSLQRTQLAAGLASVGNYRLPYPAGPANFTRSNGQFAGGYWRVARWHASCACFQVPNPGFKLVYR